MRCRGAGLAGMVFAAAMLATGVSWSGAARAETWVAVATGPNGEQYEFDSTSLTERGAGVQATTRVRLKSAMKDNLSGRSYVTAVTKQMQNCGEKVSATINYAFFDEHAAMVGTYDPPQSQWRYTTPSSGSIGDQFQTRICQAAQAAGIKIGTPQSVALTGDPAPYIAALQPMLKVGPATTGWKFLSTDARKASWYLLPTSVGQLDEARVVYITKATEVTPLRRADGSLFTTSYVSYVANCEEHTVGLAIADFYDAQGKLVISVKRSQLSEVRMAPPLGEERPLLALLCKDDPARPQVSEISTGAIEQADEGGEVAGTAWLGPKGYLITANHVVEGTTKLTLMQEGKDVGTAEVVLADPANDVAVLKAHLNNGPHAAIGLYPQLAPLGERIFTLSFPSPDALGVSLKMTSGEISALAGRDAVSQRIDDLRFMQFSAPIQSGSSGGPVMTDDGRAVGIVISRVERTDATETAQNVNYALKINYVRILLEELPDIGGYRPPRPEPTRAAAVADLQHSVFLILGEKAKAAR